MFKMRMRFWLLVVFSCILSTRGQRNQAPYFTNIWSWQIKENEALGKSFFQLRHFHVSLIYLASNYAIIETLLVFVSFSTFLYSSF